MAAIVDVHGLSRPDLWKRIEEEPLPSQATAKTWLNPASEVSFAGRLERELGLTQDSALRLLAEYRRFLYLKALDGGRLTPSKWVDAAWHLHLASPGDAWNRYSEDVLRCRVIHETGLSKDEARTGFARLLDLYRREFAADPPADIWHHGASERRRKRGLALIWAGAAIFFCVVILSVVLQPAGPLPFLGIVFGLGMGLYGAELARRHDIETANCG